MKIGNARIYFDKVTKENVEEAAKYLDINSVNYSSRVSNFSRVNGNSYPTKLLLTIAYNISENLNPESTSILKFSTGIATNIMNEKGFENFKIFDTNKLANEDIPLNSILNLSEDEILNSKIAFNDHSNHTPCLDLWLENKDVNYSYWAYSGKSQHIKVGMTIFGFVKILNENDKWLLVTAGEVTRVDAQSINSYGVTAQHVEIEKFKPFLGKLIIKFKKGNKVGGFLFYLKNYLNEIAVDKILSEEYGDFIFPGYNDFNVEFSYLNRNIDNDSWKAPLKAVFGIYLITDLKTNKSYVGSAYGVDGLYGRWKTYLKYGYDKTEEESGKRFPNSKLKEIVNKNGLDYIRKNFEYSILEILPKNFTPHEVIKRENHWKNILKTKKTGLNMN